jgi:hypothetical protein
MTEIASFFKSKSTFDIPSKKMDRRQDNCTLGDIFEKDESGTPLHFNAELRRHTGLTYRIPEHQRHPAWKKQAKQLLVDTVFRNYPMSGFVVSEHCEDGEIYYDFEDGQSRMSILQEYFNDGFAYETDSGHQVKFSQLSHSVQRRFENYRIYIEVMYKYETNAQYEVFERLQFGEPLKDKDMYWNRREYPYVKKAMELIKTPTWRGLYMNTSKGISDKERTALPSVVTFVYAIIQYNAIKQREESASKRKTMWKCFRAQGPVLKEDISDADHKRIDNFLEYLNYIIDEVYRIYPKQTRERLGIWNNFAKQTGMILHEWLETEHESAETKSANQKKWSEMMVLERKSGNLMFKKGKKTMWNGMDTSHKQNTDDASVAARLERMNAFYENREEVSAEHGIVYCIDNEGDANDESTDGEE